jgi:predicted RNase H-like nuclease (RuvC/YqgF family)
MPAAVVRVELLREKEIAGVVAEGEMAPAVREHFLELRIPIFYSKNLPVQRINKMPFVRPEDVMAALAVWEEEMKARLARLHEERLEGLFQEYRVERKKEEKRKQKLAKEALGPAN